MHAHQSDPLAVQTLTLALLKEIRLATHRNPGLQWRTEFDGKGFTVTPDHGQWTWGLELIGYSERKLLPAPYSITYEGGNISCKHDENTNGAGYFSLSQVQSLNIGTPLIARDQVTGKFKLTMDWKKSTNLTDFLDFPAPAGSAVSISPQGDVEFEFPSTDNAAFYRIEME